MDANYIDDCKDMTGNDIDTINKVIANALKRVKGNAIFEFITPTMYE